MLASFSFRLTLNEIVDALVRGNIYMKTPSLKYLHENNIGGTGTIRENHLENCNLMNAKEKEA